VSKTTNVIKLLNPKIAESKYVGGEPIWKFQPTEDNRISQLGRAFAWYNYHYGKKDAKEMLAHWLDHNGRNKDAKKLRSIPDSQIRLTPAWVCRMNLVGLELTEHEQCVVDTQISEMLKSKSEIKPDKAQVDADAEVARVTIQDRLREKVSECAGELEGMFDDFVVNGAKMTADWKPMAQIRGMNISPNMVSMISDGWKKRLDELQEVNEGKDAQLVEGYSNFTKMQLRNMIKFAEQVIADCASYVQIKKTERAPRKKKPVSAEKLTARFKYMKQFDELKLVSEPVTKLVGANEAWLYDTKKRKLIYVVADSHAGTFTVKGSALVGFDPTNSLQKTLRKPAEQIKALLQGGVAQHRKYFKDIKSTEVKYNGRGNENLVLLKIR
jgi:hypothetical protein